MLFGICLFFHIKISIFRYLKLEIALAIPASNERKIEGNNWAAEGLSFWWKVQPSCQLRRKWRLLLFPLLREFFRVGLELVSHNVVDTCKYADDFSLCSPFVQHFTQGLYEKRTGRPENLKQNNCTEAYTNVDSSRYFPPHDVLKHNFTSLKTNLIFLQLRVLWWKFPCYCFAIHSNFL